MRGFAILIVLALASASPSAAQDRCDAAPMAVVPLVVADGRIMVEVAVNSHPARFVIDTGGFATVVSRRLAESLNLPLHRFRGGNRPQDVGGGLATQGADVASLTLGGRQMYAWAYAVADTPPGTDGLLANDVLRTFDLDFDFAAHRLALYPPLACAGKPPGTLAFSTVVIRPFTAPNLPTAVVRRPDAPSVSTVMTSSSPLKIRIPIVLDGRELFATLDTGAARSYIAASQARESFGVALERGAGSVRGTFGGSVAVSPHGFGSLRIGDAVLEKPRLYLIDEGLGETPVLLGLEQLRELRLFISLSGHRLYISRPLR